MYNVSWQVIPFPYSANKKRIFVTITNRSSQVKFIVVVIALTVLLYANYRQTQRNLGKRDDQYQKLSYNIEPEIEILSASLEFAILISYNGTVFVTHLLHSMKECAHVRFAI